MSPAGRALLLTPSRVVVQVLRAGARLILGNDTPCVVPAVRPQVSVHVRFASARQFAGVGAHTVWFTFPATGHLRGLPDCVAACLVSVSYIAARWK